MAMGVQLCPGTKTTEPHAFESRVRTIALNRAPQVGEPHGPRMLSGSKTNSPSDSHLAVVSPPATGAGAFSVGRPGPPPTPARSHKGA